MDISVILNIVFPLLALGILFWIMIKIVDKKEKKTSLSTGAFEKSQKEGLQRSRESRGYPRINLNMSVLIKKEDNEVMAETKDISFMGAFIITRNRFMVNEKIKLNIVSKIKPNTWLDAIVIWSNTGLPENKVIIPGFGVKFINIKEKEKLLLKKLLAETR